MVLYAVLDMGLKTFQRPESSAVLLFHLINFVKA